MTANERYKKRTQERQLAGLCPECGKPMDRKGWRCSQCIAKRRKYNAETRKFRKERGFCPKCGKNRLIGDERVCPECTAKEYSYKMQNRRENKQRYNNYMREYHKKQYQERKESGICTRCGKRKASPGYFTCAICREKSTAQKRAKNYTEIRKERVKNRLCFFCGEPVEPGYKVCKKHHEMCKKNATTKAANAARRKLIEEGVFW